MMPAKKAAIERVDFIVLRDYWPAGFPEPLLRAGETSWMAGRDVRQIAEGLVREGYIRRIGVRGRLKGHGERFHAILRRLNEGLSQRSVAAEFGITQAAVS